MTRGTTAAAAAVFAGTIGIVSAAPAFAQPVPSYASGTSDETIRGTVAAINGPYNISVRDERGFVDNVNLHQGTIINPTGLSLAPGLSMTILGHNEATPFPRTKSTLPIRRYRRYRCIRRMATILTRMAVSDRHIGSGCDSDTTSASDAEASATMMAPSSG
jgi:hypothetical protein